jgi:hypothetical protein
MRPFTLGLVAVSLVLGGVGKANAGVLLDLEDPLTQTNTPFALTFIAGANSTILEFAGYHVPANLTASHIDLTQTGGVVNLLGGTWTFTPASSGSDTSTYSDGTGVPALRFAGVEEDFFDRYSQTIPTVIGQSYALSFLLTDANIPSAPSELVVLASDANPIDSGAVPEPSSLVVSSILLGIFGVVRLRKRTTVEF